MKTIGYERRCSILMCPVLTSSTPRSLRKYFTTVTIFIIIFYYNYYKSCYLGKIVSNIFGNCTVHFGMEVWQIWHAFPTASIVAWYFPRTQPIFVLLPLSEKTPIPFCEPHDKVLRKKTSFSFVRSDFLSCLPNHFSGFRKL